MPFAQPQVGRHRSSGEAIDLHCGRRASVFLCALPRPPLQRPRRVGPRKARENGQAGSEQHRPQVRQAIGQVRPVVDAGEESANEQRHGGQEHLRREQKGDRQQEVGDVGTHSYGLSDIVDGTVAQRDGVERFAAEPIAGLENALGYRRAVHGGFKVGARAPRAPTEIPQHDRSAKGTFAARRFAGLPRPRQHGRRHLAVLVHGLIALRMARVGTTRFEFGRESLHGQVVGQLIAEMMQQEEERGGEERDGPTGRNKPRRTSASEYPQRGHSPYSPLRCVLLHWAPLARRSLASGPR